MIRLLEANTNNKLRLITPIRSKIFLNKYTINNYLQNIGVIISLNNILYIIMSHKHDYGYVHV
jgi:hypothetical protein